MGEFLDQVSWEQDLWTSVVEGAMRGMPWLTDVAWPGRTWPERKHEYSGIDWELPADWQERLNATTGEPGRRLAATRSPGALAATPCGLLLCGSVSWNPMCCPESAQNPTPRPPFPPRQSGTGTSRRLSRGRVPLRLKRPAAPSTRRSSRVASSTSSRRCSRRKAGRCLRSRTRPPAAAAALKWRQPSGSACLWTSCSIASTVRR